MICENSFFFFHSFVLGDCLMMDFKVIWNVSFLWVYATSPYTVTFICFILLYIFRDCLFLYYLILFCNCKRYLPMVSKSNIEKDIVRSLASFCCLFHPNQSLFSLDYYLNDFIIYPSIVFCLVVLI